MNGRMERFALPLLLGLTAATYAGLGAAGFVWDDHALVLEDARLDHLSSLPSLLSHDLWATSAAPDRVSGYFRPLFSLSLLVDRLLWGQSAIGAHLHSLAWHLLAVGLLHRVLRQVAAPGPALAGASLFALHPAQSEAVAWVSGRSDPMAAAAAFAALAIVFPVPASRARLTAGAGLAALACLCKESVALLPLLLLSLDLAARGEGAAGRRWQRYLALGVGVALAFLLRLLVGVAGTGLPEWTGLALLGRHLLAVGATLAGSVVFPWPLGGAWSLDWPDPPTTLWLGATALVGAGLGSIVVLEGRGRALALGGLVWLAATIPPLAIPIADKGLFGTRYLYLPLAGLGLWVAGIWSRRGARLLVVLVPAWLVVLFVRLPAWADDLSLWQAAAAEQRTPVAWDGYARALVAEGRSPEAMPWFLAAASADPPHVPACVQAVAVPLELGRAAEARAAADAGEAAGCPRTGEQVALWSVAHFVDGDLQSAERLLDGAGADPRGRDIVVRAALARARGDAAAYAALAADWQGETPLGEQVAVLLRSQPLPSLHQPDRHPGGGE